VSRPSTHEAIALWVESLRKRGRARLTIAGQSMAPVLPEGCEVEVEVSNGSELSVGDIVVIQAEDGLLTHRVLARVRGRSATLLLQKGDAGRDSSVVMSDRVVGRVLGRVDRGGIRLIDSGEWRAAHRLRVAYAWALRPLLPLGHWLQRRAAACPARHPVRAVTAFLRRLVLLPFGVP
jgi:hypothetical protein